MTEIYNVSHSLIKAINTKKKINRKKYLQTEEKGIYHDNINLHYVYHEQQNPSNIYDFIDSYGSS